MPSRAETSEPDARSRRRGSAALTVTAVLLLLGGGTAVAAGVVDQDAAPTVRSSSARSTPEPTQAPAAMATAEADDALTAPAVEAPSAPLAALPVEVRIPAIGVKSELLAVGLDADGALEVLPPGPDYDTAAWYEGSARPGDPGPAVIEGHVDSAANGPSIFYRLGELVPGDKVDVLRGDGTTVSFEVDEIRAVPKADFPTLEVYGRTPDPQLRLITCGGDLGADGHYVDNTVVFAHQI